MLWRFCPFKRNSHPFGAPRDPLTDFILEFPSRHAIVRCPSRPPELVFDADFQGQADADKRFKELVKEAQSGGFRVPATMEILEFQSKAQEQMKARG